MLSLAQCIHTACLLEATAPKPGNVHRGADFEDLTYVDFLLAAQAISPILATANERSLGESILTAVHATRAVTGTNVNLGIILLLAPLAKIPRDQPWQSGLQQVWSELTARDCELVYQAITAAQPGGLGNATEGDVNSAPPNDLLQAMRWGAERDSIARQYANNYQEVATLVLPALQENLQQLPTLSAIVRSFVQVLAQLPDTLIARKCGSNLAQQASDWAAEVLQAGEESTESYYHALADLDFWLRSDGHKRNPGTTADLLCAGLFIALRDGWLQPPFRWEE
jgi:triphosphoribosyl-dephospho-CoA synthase